MTRRLATAVLVLLALGQAPARALEFSLYDAAKAGNVETVRRLIAEGAEVDLPNESDAPIHAAAASGTPEVIELLIAAGADVNQIGFPGTALHVAAARGDMPIAKLLISRGADVERADNFGNTALHNAATHGRSDIAAALLAAGADVNAKTKSGTPPLVGAVTSGDLDTVRLLLDSGSGVDWIDPFCYGETLVHLAVREGDEPLVRELLRAGANPNVTSGRGDTPLSLALQSGETTLVNLLREAVASN